MLSQIARFPSFFMSELHSSYTYIYMCSVDSVIFDSSWPYRLYPTRLFCPWGFSRQEYWSGLLCPLLGNLPNSGIEPMSPVAPALQADSLPLRHWGSLSLSPSVCVCVCVCMCVCVYVYMYVYIYVYIYIKHVLSIYKHFLIHSSNS